MMQAPVPRRNVDVLMTIASATGFPDHAQLEGTMAAAGMFVIGTPTAVG
jgi:hypothetical protein